MTKQTPKTKKNKLKVSTSAVQISRNRSNMTKMQNRESDPKRKQHIVLMPGVKIMKDIEKLTNEGPNKPKNSNDSDISKIILGNLENVLGKVKKAAIAESQTKMKVKIGEKKSQAAKTKSDEAIYSMSDEDPHTIEVEKNPPPLRKLLNGKTEEEKKMIKNKITSMLNEPHDIKFVDEDAKKIYQQKSNKPHRGLAANNKAQAIPAKQSEDKAKEKVKKPINEEQLLKRFVKNGMKLPPDKTERRKIIDRLWQTKRSLWKKRAQIMKQIEESSRAELRQRELKDQGDLPTDSAPIVKTYIVPNTVKAVKNKSKITNLDSVVYIESGSKGKHESEAVRITQDIDSKLVEKANKPVRPNYIAWNKKVILGEPKVNISTSKFLSKNQNTKVVQNPNVNKRENKLETNKGVANNKTKTRHTLLTNRQAEVKEGEENQEVREHELLGREQLGVSEKAYKQIVQEVASFVKKEEKKIVQNLCDKFKGDSKYISMIKGENPKIEDDNILRDSMVNNYLSYTRSTSRFESNIIPSKPKLKLPQQIRSEVKPWNSKTIKQLVNKPEKVKILKRTGSLEKNISRGGLKPKNSIKRFNSSGNKVALKKISSKHIDLNKRKVEKVIAAQPKSTGAGVANKKPLKKTKNVTNPDIQVAKKPSFKVSENKIITENVTDQKEKKPILKVSEKKNKTENTTKLIAEPKTYQKSTETFVTDLPKKANYQDVQEQAKRKAKMTERLRIKMMENKRIFAEMRKHKQKEPSILNVVDSRNADTDVSISDPISSTG